MNQVFDHGVNAVGVDEVDDGRQQLKQLCYGGIHELLDHGNQRMYNTGDRKSAVLLHFGGVFCRIADISVAQVLHKVLRAAVDIERFKQRHKGIFVAFRARKLQLDRFRIFAQTVAFRKEGVVAVCQNPRHYRRKRLQQFDQRRFKDRAVGVHRCLGAFG